MLRVNSEMKDCIELCWECRTACQNTLFTHCLEEGGEHLEGEHVRIMADCIQICQAAADSMMRDSPMHQAICEACAAICDSCAESCDALEGEHMERCAELCRECAESCRMMGGMQQAA